MRFWIVLAAVFGGGSVAMGAFAAHGLEGSLPGGRIDWMDTASLYAMVHALALLGVAWLSERRGGFAIHLAGAGFTVGVILFSGGLYVAALTDLRQIMPVVPLGGLAFLAGWAALLVVGLRRPPDQVIRR